MTFPKLRPLLSLLLPLAFALLLSVLLPYAFPLYAPSVTAAPQAATMLGWANGGGRIAGSEGAQASFRFDVSHTKEGGVEGWVMYTDSSAGIRFRSATIQTLDIEQGDSTDSFVATYSGRGQLAGVGAVRFMVVASDKSEIGVGNDSFEITLAGGYLNDGPLTAGNTYIGCLTCTRSLEAPLRLAGE